MWTPVVLGLILAANLNFLAANDSIEDEDDLDHFLQVCEDPRASMWVAPESRIILNIPESSGHSVIFVERIPEFIFECRLEGPVHSSLDDLDVTFSSPKLQSEAWVREAALHRWAVRRTLNTNRMKNKNLVNKANETVSCLLGNIVVCSTTVIAMRSQQTSCEGGRTIGCPVDEFVNAAASERSATDLFATGRDFSVGTRDFIPYLTAGESSFEPTIQYSIYHDGQWIYCQEYDANSTALTVTTSRESHTASIQCPIEDVDDLESGPVIVRLEKNQQSGISVGLPTLTDLPTHYTYFVVYVNKTIYAEDQDDDEDDDVDVVLPVVFGVFSVCLLAAVSIIAIMCIKKKKMDKMNTEEQQHQHNPYSTIPPPLIATSSEFSGDTDYTDLSSNGYQHQLSWILNRLTPEARQEFHNILKESMPEGNTDFNSVELDTEKLGRLRRCLVSRQLSGDPSRVDPERTLNEQTNVIPYNPQLEIDRSNFSYSKLLGKGQFGCVYDGEAVGLFHPSSRTRVAVKTVRSPTNLSQIDTLIAECKILSVLELHLNLVNLMGSCTSSLQETGELWLLLEFCTHGNLKNFLINHRQEFKNNIEGICSTNLNTRLFVKWAHHIAKGMEYLSSKRIMHGDLAARNILVSGEDDKLVAKVGDFGLSKCFYDNVDRYKRQNRNYVPWKWMAIEYLTDGNLLIKSDVWSYGVLIWEIYALGEEPYVGKTIQDIVKGYRLACPEYLERETAWVPKDIYEQITKQCWIEEKQRATFSDIVATVKDELYQEERALYEEQSEEYRSMSKLMLDADTRLKRVSSKKQMNNPGYQKAAHLDILEEETPNPSNPPSGYQMLSEVLVDRPDPIGPVMNFINHHQPPPANGGGSYISVATSNNMASTGEPERMLRNGYVEMTKLTGDSGQSSPPPPNGYLRASVVTTGPDES